MNKKEIDIIEDEDLIDDIAESKMETYTFVVGNLDVKKRLDIFLCENLSDFTRSYIKTLIEKGNVYINGKNSIKSGALLKLNDEVVVNVPQVEMLDIKPQDIPLDIVYEDDDIIIVNKEKGVVVHPANGNYENTLVNALMFLRKDNLSTINGVIRPGIVHRIDKDTSGILVIAKNDNAHKNLSQQFKVHSIKREYIALVKGIIKEDEMTINLPIGRNPKDRKKMAVSYKNSKEAITHVKVLKRYYNSNLTLVSVTLDTGRTHQIRVHMAYNNHPLLGDEVYGKKDTKFKVVCQALHAKKLGFIHPTKNYYVEFESELPKYFKDLLDVLDKREDKL